MKKSSSLRTPESKALNREKRKADFTATGRDWAAGVAAIGASALVVKTGKIAQWEELAIEKFHVEKVIPDWTLQQHIDYQQIIGMCGYFFLIYITLSIAFCFPRYLIFDSPLPALFDKIGNLMLRVFHWLTAKIRTQATSCLKLKEPKDCTKSDAS